MTRWRRLALGCAAALALAELGLRLFVPAPARLEPPRVDPPGYSPFVRLASGLAVYRAGARYAYVYDPAGDPAGYFGPEGRLEIAIGALGFRGPERDLDKAPGVRRVVCLGDSFTFGEGVRAEHAWPARLEALLGPDVEVVNAGVQGMGTPEELAFFDSHCAALDPDVVVLGFFMNDPVDWERTVATQLERPAPPSPLARISRLVGLWEHGRRARATRRALVADIRQGFRAPRWQTCVDALAALKERAARDGFELVVAVFPLLLALDGEDPLRHERELVRAACASLGLPCVQIHAAWRGRRDADLWAHPTDMHPNPEAHRLAAERIAAALR
jgi:lysophospholipase L1-like esterase